MAGLTIMLGRCSFCGAPASRTLRLAGGTAGPARICRRCANSFCAPIAEATDDSGDDRRRVWDLELAVTKDPDDIRSRLELGELYLGSGDSRRAANQYLLVGESYCRDGFWLKAVAVFKKVLQIDAERLEVFMRLGDVYRQLGLTADAVGEYELAARHFDSTGMTDASLAASRRVLEIDPKNLDACRRIAQLDPSDRENLRRLAALYLARGETPRAVVLLQKLCRSAPRDVSSWSLLADAFQVIAPEKVEALRQEIARIESGAESVTPPLVLDPPDPVEEVTIREVLAEFRKGVEKVLGREDLQARLDLGIAYSEMGLWDEAIDEFTLAAAQPSLCADAHALIAGCHRDAGRIDEAVRSISGAIKTSGVGDLKKASYFYELAHLFVLRGDEAKAYKCYQQAVALDPTGHREYPGKTRPHLKGAREAFAGGGSRDAFRPSRDEPTSGHVDDKETILELERRLRARPEELPTRVRLALLLAEAERVSDACGHYRIAAQEYRKEGNSPKAKMCDDRIAKLSADAEPQELTCSFCARPADHVRPPATSSEATLCADCLLHAQEVLALS